MTDDDVSGNLLENFGGASAIPQFLDNWYSRIDEQIEGCEIEADSLIRQRQTNTLIKLLEGTDRDYYKGPGHSENATIHDAHQCFELNGDILQKTGLIFRDMVKELGLGDEITKQICDRVGSALSNQQKNKSNNIMYSLLPDHVTRIKRQFAEVVETIGSLEQTGFVLQDGIYNVSERLKALFSLPQNIQGFRFVQQLQRLVNLSGDIESLNSELYVISMRHIQHISPAQVREWMEPFCRSVENVIAGVLEDQWDPSSKEAWQMFFQYCGQSIVQDLTEFSGKIAILRKSWALIAVSSIGNATRDESGGDDSGGGGGDGGGGAVSGAQTPRDGGGGNDRQSQTGGQSGSNVRSSESRVKVDVDSQDYFKGINTLNRRQQEDEITDDFDIFEDQHYELQQRAIKVFGESLYFNLTVMSAGPTGISGLFKMKKEDLAISFGSFFSKIVMLISSPEELDEECYVLALRHINYGSSLALVPQFGQAFVVTLRSLLPKAWSWQHEDAWNWLWGIMESRFKTALENGQHSKTHIDETMIRLSKEDMEDFSLKYCTRLFSLTNDIALYFAKPNGIFRYILSKIFYLISSLNHDPVVVCAEIRACGIRHVKYSTPERLVSCIPTALIHTMSSQLQGFWCEEVEFGWRNSFEYISNTFRHAIRSGSNLVTSCCIRNSVEELKPVISQAPRGDRAMWLLEISAIGATLSPFYWALFDAKSELVKFILKDVTTIRADREAYYCGVDDLFLTHPGVIENMSLFDSASLEVLFDGLVWVSRNNERGHRRVNYFCRHLYGDPTLPSGRFKSPYKSPLNSLTKLTSVNLFMHPVTQFLINLKWNQFAKKAYISSIMPFIAMMILFVLGYIVFAPDANQVKENSSYNQAAKGFRITGVFLNFAVLGILQIPRLYREVQRDQLGLWYITERRALKLPYFLFKTSNVCKFLINLFLVIAFCTDELITTSFGNWIGGRLMTRRVHSWMVCLCSVLFFTQFLDLYVLQIDMAKFKLQLSLSTPEVVPFVFALFFLYIGFGSALMVVPVTNPDRNDNPTVPSWRSDGTPLYEEVIDNQTGEIFTTNQPKSEVLILNRDPGFDQISVAICNVFSVAISSYDFEWGAFSLQGELYFVSFCIITILFLLATLSATMASTCYMLSANIEGRAYRQKAQDIIELETLLSMESRISFWNVLKFDEQIEFDEGDLGLPGAIQIIEPVTLHNFPECMIDCIFRYAGEAGPDLAWPISESDEDNNIEPSVKLERSLAGLEKKLHRSYRQMRDLIRKFKGGMGGGGSMLGSSSLSQSRTMEQSEGGESVAPVGKRLGN